MSVDPVIGPLLEARRALMHQRQELDAALNGLDALIQQLDGPIIKGSPASPAQRVTKTGEPATSELVLALLREVGHGLDSKAIVTELPKRGSKGNEASMRTMLARMVKRGELVKDGKLYDLPERHPKNADSPTTDEAEGLSEGSELARGGEVPDAAPNSDHREVPGWNNGHGGYTAVASF